MKGETELTKGLVKGMTEVMNGCEGSDRIN